MASTTSSPPAKPSKAYSCVRCYKRKVKCDKQYPCAACLHENVECVSRRPEPPRRRAPRSTDAALVARLKHYEQLLRENGIDPNGSPSTTASTGGGVSPSPSMDAYHSVASASMLHRLSLVPSADSPFSDYPEGKLVVDQGKTRFIENKLWKAVTEESHNNKDVIPDTDSEDEMDTLADDDTDFVLATPSSINQTDVLHPTTSQMLKLWQIFLTNVNPLIKIIHQPTLQNTIESIVDLDQIPRGLEALMFAIYGAAVLSMRDGECQATFGESRSTLQSRYSLGSRRSLTKARFIGSSDITVLQALVIYLLTMRQDLDSRTLWTLSGVAIRIAQGMGLHRDGTVLGLPPFETEMRRRLWWQVILLDFNATELGGFGLLGEASWWNTKSPANINDSDIWPGMKEPPIERVGATEMIACLLHREACTCVIRKLIEKGTADKDHIRAMRDWLESATASEQDGFINDLKSHMEEKFLKYCDLAEPLHMMASLMGNTIITRKIVQIKASNSRRSTTARPLSISEQQFLWTASLNQIETDNTGHSYRSLQKFHWHMDANFQWHALIYVLGELITRPIGGNKDDAWSQIEDVFKYHPDFITNYKKPLHIAIANMCLKAWQSRHNSQMENPQGSSWLETPQFILQLQKQREDSEAEANAKRNEKAELSLANVAQNDLLMTYSQPTETSTMPNISSKQLQLDASFDQSVSPEFLMPLMDDMAINWETWDTLLSGFDPLLLPPSVDHMRF